MPIESPSPASDLPAPVAQPLEPEALARRRLLLKGLGAGTAAGAAAFAPIQSLAAPSLPVKLCTVSGSLSAAGVGSGRTGLTTASCKGYSPVRYQTLANWPNTNGTSPNPSSNLGATVISPTTAFNAVFIGGSANTFLSILTSAPGSIEAVWVTALLNAIVQPPGFNFPYTPAEVIAFYSSPSAADAVAFFQNYLQAAG